MQNNKSVRRIFSASKHFLHFFITCINFKIHRYQSYFLLLLAFFMTFYICQKSVTRVGTRGPPGLLSSRVAITSHQYTITLYTSGHLQISWDVFALKSADMLSFRISFITISNSAQIAHKLVSTSSVKQVPRAYCTNIYTVGSSIVTQLMWYALLRY